MKIVICALLLMLSTHQAFAQDQEVTKPIKQLFDAMRNHDGEKLLKQFSSNAQLERASIKKSVTQTDLQKFANFVSASEKYLDEKLLSYTVHVSDNLASVWTPYVFYIDGKLSHCGVNSFQLIHSNKQWKIQYLIDNTHPGDCKAFINTHKKTSD